MIERMDFGCFEAICDNCEEGRQFDVHDNWQELIRQMDAEGWTKQKVGGEWEHYCPACSEG